MGTLVVTRKEQLALLRHFINLIHSKQPELALAFLSSTALCDKEPELSGLSGVYLPHEAQINVEQLLPALIEYLLLQGGR